MVAAQAASIVGAGSKSHLGRGEVTDVQHALRCTRVPAHVLHAGGVRRLVDERSLPRGQPGG